MSTELKAGAVLAALLLAVGVAFAVTSDEDDGASDAARMTLERGISATGLGEVLVTVTGDAKVAPDAKFVSLRCLDADERAVTTAQYPWPLEKDDEEPQPHVHQAAAPSELERIEQCRIGTTPELSARLPLR